MCAWLGKKPEVSILLSLILGLFLGKLGCWGWNETETFFEELSRPLRLKPIAEMKVPSFRKTSFKQRPGFYFVEIDGIFLNRFQLTYYLSENQSSCGFRYRFNNSTLPMLVKRGEPLGILHCLNKESNGEFTSSETAVISYCYGEVQLSYPFFSSPIISIKEDDGFLVQYCAKKFPDYRGIPYRFPMVPEEQHSINSTLFDVHFENSTSSYWLKEPERFKECVVNKLFHNESFQVLEYSILGVITCKFQSPEKKLTLKREVIRSLCPGTSSFHHPNRDPRFGIFQANSKIPFVIIKCSSTNKKNFDKRLLNPDQAIKDLKFILEKNSG
ncbi:hypothetical protein HWI79_2512 [Cryptosporidium felis]|nr:hypothetical protein HWI79_2512 [Cryptosporidium felis]